MELIRYEGWQRHAIATEGCAAGCELEDDLDGELLAVLVNPACPLHGPLVDEHRERV